MSDRFDMRRLSMAVCVVASCAFAAPALTGNIYLILAITGGISGKSTPCQVLLLILFHTHTRARAYAHTHLLKSVKVELH